MSESSENSRPFDGDLAVIIGINEYENGIPKLKTAKSDAERLAKILKEKHGYQEVKRFIDKDATSNKIWNYLKTELPEKIEKIKQDKNKQDKNKPKRVRLLFHFAGHGTAPQGEDGEAGYLLPQDAEVNKHDKYLSMKEIHDVLTQLGCHHLLIILDCCYAGAFRFGTRDLGSIPEELSKERYERYYKDCVGQVITSAAHDQKALDILESVAKLKDDRGTIENSKHSPFAGLLFKALEEGDADCTKDGITTVTELNLYLSEKLRGLTQNQSKPQVSRTWCLPKLDKGEFFFQTGEFDPTKLPEAINLNKDNNPYRGLESFEEAHSRLFFGRSKEIDILYNKQIDSTEQPLTVVLGISGSGKSSLVKAGLIPRLRENSIQWRILEPIRPGATPFKALAKAVLPLTLEDSDPDFEPLKELDELLRQARKKDPNDNNLNNLFAKWRGSAPEDKLLLIIKNFDRLKELCGERIEQKTLENLRKMGLSRSKLVLDNFDELKQDSDSAEQKQLLSTEEQEQLNSFHKECSQKIQDWSEEWREDGERFGKFIFEKCFQDKKILLVIDQFEELITQCNQEERKQFLNALQAALKSCSERLRIVLTLRDDFRHDFENSEQLQEYWKQACFSVAAMGREQLRQAIEQPALAQVLYFEEKNGESLVNQLLDDIGDTSGVLPLLSFTLSELYCKYVEKARNDRTRTLRWEDYDELGNVTKALTRKATEEYENLKYDFDKNGQAVEIDASEVQARQTILRWVMLRMVSLDGGVPTKRAVVDAELVYADEKSNEICKLVINRFVNARLFVRGTNHKEEKYIEPAHDVLIREWSLLKEWITLEQENLVLQKRLAASTLDWNSAKETQKAQFLWKQDPRIQLLENIAKSENNWLNKLELDFVKACVEYREIQARERLEKEIESNIEKSQKLFNANDRLDAIVNMIKTGKLLQKGQKITEQKKLSFIIIFNHLLSQLGEINSINIGEQVNNFSCNQEAQVIATLSGKTNDKISFWDWKGKLINSEENEDNVYDLAFSPDGKILVTGGNDGIIKFYRKEDNSWHSFYKTQGDTKKHSGAVICVNFSHDGNVLVSVGSDRNINFWEREGKFIKTFITHDHNVGNVAFSPKGKLIAFVIQDRKTGRGTIKILEYQLYEDRENQAVSSQGNSLLEFEEFDPGHEGEISAIDFSPDGKTLVSGGKDGKLRIWLISRDCSKITNNGFTDEEASISSVAFSPDGKIVASSHTNGIINLWDISITEANYQLQKLYKLAGHKDEINRISFTLDGFQLLSSSNDGTVKFWSFKDRFAGQTRSEVKTVSFSGDNKIVTTVDRKGNLKFWSSTGELLKIFIDNTSDICDVQLSRDNEIIVAGASEGEVEVKLYSLDGAIKAHSIIKHEQIINSLNFSPKENIFVTTSKDNTISLWRINRDPDTLNVKLWKKLTGHHEKITAITFSEDGKFFASGSDDGTIKLWNLGTNQADYTIPDVGSSIVHDDLIERWCKETTGKIYALKFCYKDKIIVSINQPGYIDIWSIDGTSQKRIEALNKQALDIEIEAAAFSSNGKGIAMATRINERYDSYRRIQTYNLSLEKLIETAFIHIQNYIQLDDIKFEDE
ncbi:caspase family protein [Brasilonema sp. UFV-L1]|uniref:nSTAND1 domain-containing NTPase n=1 Tax=Brasilonema sp. UFV-L1 TaxID=2234130 RepID=UPI00145D2530|nr:caspase family protein [Brasilonema sp. UFV-L1]NMG09759.1 hypothetical protein [Brasilonema sp. UFV-L1]